jgi:hypothetical protein
MQVSAARGCEKKYLKKKVTERLFFTYAWGQGTPDKSMTMKVCTFLKIASIKI